MLVTFIVLPFVAVKFTFPPNCFWINCCTTFFWSARMVCSMECLCAKHKTTQYNKINKQYNKSIYACINAGVYRNMKVDIFSFKNGELTVSFLCNDGYELPIKRQCMKTCISPKRSFTHFKPQYNELKWIWIGS